MAKNEKKTMTLDELKISQSARIIQVYGQGATRKRLLDMGLTPKTKVKLVKFAPMNDPMEITLRGYELSLRLEDARNITIEPVAEDEK